MMEEEEERRKIEKDITGTNNMSVTELDIPHTLYDIFYLILIIGRLFCYFPFTGEETESQSLNKFLKFTKLAV